MTSDELRALQAPLKARYRDDASAARTVLSARGHAGAKSAAQSGVHAPSCRVDSARPPALAGLHPATGGDGTLLCSGDMLLESLVACAGVTLSSVATAIGIDLRDAAITADGDIDWRGTLGVAKDVPVGFSEIRLKFAVDCDATDEQLTKLIILTERYCVVFQTLRGGVPVKTSHARL